MKQLKHNFYALLLLMFALSFIKGSAQLKHTDLFVEEANKLVMAERANHLNIGNVGVDSLYFMNDTLYVMLNKLAGYLPFRRDNVDRLYKGFSSLVSSLEGQEQPLVILADEHRIEDLVPLSLGGTRQKTWGDLYKAYNKPLVRSVGSLNKAEKGLAGKHIALWQSHGWYFEKSLNRWEWQRARMFQTVEDLYTQSYVLPFLVPMLENSGAVVLLPRERDVSTHEYIIDNDPSEWLSGSYSEVKGKWRSQKAGFAYAKQLFRDSENPFKMGTYRQTTTSQGQSTAQAFWRPNIVEDGEYAVYISYKTVPNSTEEALYTVHHEGGKSSFLVNQTMGGGTWIYLGHFPFKAGEHPNQGVELSNIASESGKIVTADAVKIGGGVGNIERAYAGEIKASAEEPLKVCQQAYQASGYPRFCEGARYWLQWAGMPDSVYSPTKGENDYTDDYRCRGYWVNHLVGGTPANPEVDGLNIPIDVSFAFHSDAGTLLGDTIIGTLGIYNTTWTEGMLPSGMSREASRDLTDLVQSQIVSDVMAKHSPEWRRRGMWNQAYSEATIPVVPSMLLELLSHQNFSDMRYGLDPHFRFTVSRAVYKGILKFLSTEHGVPYVVQPLPVRAFAIDLDKAGQKAHLTWTATKDELEPTAVPNSYIVYTAEADGPWDSGTLVTSTDYTVALKPGSVYSFKVVAMNDGGVSFPSEVLSVGIAPESKGEVMVVNGFTRVSAPDWFDFPSEHVAGFKYNYDNGVPYRKDISLIGAQKEFDRTKPWIDDDATGFGDSYGDLETKVIAGNSFNYPRKHGTALLAAGYSFASSSKEYIELYPDALKKYRAVDLILGKQKQTFKGPKDGRAPMYKTFSRDLQFALESFALEGGHIIASGAYIGTDLWDNPDVESNEADREFAQEVLKYSFRADRASRMGCVKVVQNEVGLTDRVYHYCNEPSEKQYVVESPDALEPLKGGETVLRYSENNLSAGIVFDGPYKTCILGFPIESLTSQEQINHLVKEIMNFIDDNKK